MENLRQSETFNTVKDALESQQLRKLRLTNIYKAFQLQFFNNSNVEIIYKTDQEESKRLRTVVLKYNDYDITIGENRFIPIRAIKEIRF